MAYTVGKMMHLREDNIFWSDNGNVRLTQAKHRGTTHIMNSIVWNWRISYTLSFTWNCWWKCFQRSDFMKVLCSVPAWRPAVRNYIHTHKQD